MLVKPLLVSALLLASPALVAEEATPSTDFLEYLGSMAVKVNDEWVDPVSLDIENPQIATSRTGEDSKHD